MNLEYSYNDSGDSNAEKNPDKICTIYDLIPETEEALGEAKKTVLAIIKKISDKNIREDIKAAVQGLEMALKFLKVNILHADAGILDMEHLTTFKALFNDIKRKLAAGGIEIKEVENCIQKVSKLLEKKS